MGEGGESFKTTTEIVTRSDIGALIYEYGAVQIETTGVYCILGGV